MKTHKIEVLRRVANEVSSETQPVIRGSTIQEVQDFDYFRSIISRNCTLGREINIRIGKASAVFCQLKDWVYLNRNFEMSTKMKVYNALVISVILYGSDMWTTYSKQLGLLNVFLLRCLCKMLRISWQDRVTTNDALPCCNDSCLYSIVAENS